MEVQCDTQEFSVDQNIRLAIRPECIVLNSIDGESKSGSNKNCFKATIDEIEFLGSFERVYLKADDLTSNLIMVDVPSSSARDLQLAPQTDINIKFPVEDIRVYSDVS